MKLLKKPLTCNNCKTSNSKNYVSEFEDIPMFVVCTKCVKSLEQAEDIYRQFRIKEINKLIALDAVIFEE